MVDENEFEFRATLFERPLNPLILRIAKRAFPIVLPVALFLREPKRIKHDEQGVAPSPRVIVLQQSSFGIFRGVTGVETVRDRIREVALPREIGPDGQSIGIAAATARAFAVVIADHKEERRGSTELSEVIALGEILLERRVAIRVLLGHECVAEFDMKIGLVRQRVRQCPLIDHRIGVLVEMRIRRHGKRERPPRRACGVKRKHCAVRAPEPQLVEVLRIGIEPGQDDLRWLAFLELSPRRGARELACLLSVGDPARGLLVTKDAHGHRIRRGPRQNQIKRMGGHIVARGILHRLTRAAFACRFVVRRACIKQAGATEHNGENHHPSRVQNAANDVSRLKLLPAVQLERTHLHC